MVNYSRKDCIMMILAIEAGLDIPEVLFEVGASLQTGNYEMRERFAISSSIEEATHEKIGKLDIQLWQNKYSADFQGCFEDDRAFLILILCSLSIPLGL